MTGHGDCEMLIGIPVQDDVDRLDVTGPFEMFGSAELDREPTHVPAKWHPVRRQGHASTLESTAFPVHMGSLGDPI
jgi:hypothetical protein